MTPTLVMNDAADNTAVRLEYAAEHAWAGACGIECAHFLDVGGCEFGEVVFLAAWWNLSPFGGHVSIVLALGSKE